MNRVLSERGGAALAYAQEHELMVFPTHWARGDSKCSCRDSACGRVGKHPLTPHGLHDATLDEATIRRWWMRHPQANVAIRTGEIVVIDVDPDRGGAASLSALEREHGKLPATRTAETGGGGAHFYFAADPGEPVRSSVDALGLGLDTRGQGGYVIAPPSNHASGGQYRWKAELPLRPLPEWVARHCRALRTRQHSWPIDGLIPELLEMVGREEGTRNDTLNKVAFKVGLRCGDGGLGIGDAWEALVAVAATTLPSMDAAEARRTIESGLCAGMVKGLHRRRTARPRARLTRLDTGQMLRTPPPDVPWLVEPVLADGLLTIVAGREGEGKSMLSRSVSRAAWPAETPSPDTQRAEGDELSSSTLRTRRARYTVVYAHLG